MEIVVIGSHEFTLGFQLAGVTRLYNPSTEKEMTSNIKDLLEDPPGGGAKGPPGGPPGRPPWVGRGFTYRYVYTFMYVCMHT